VAKGSTISSKGQITLPKELRDKYHMKAGEAVVIVDGGDGILVKHVRPTLRGLLKGKIDSRGIEAEIRKLRQEWKL